MSSSAVIRALAVSLLMLGVLAVGASGAAAAAEPRTDAETGSSDPVLGHTLEDARALANAAREAQAQASPDADAALRRAIAASRALDSSSRAALETRLHVLRTRMLALDTTLPPQKSFVADEIAALIQELVSFETLARQLEPIESADGLRAWTLLFLAELSLREGEADAAMRYADRVLLVPESAATWDPQIRALRLRGEALVRQGEQDRALDVYRRARRVLGRQRGSLSPATFLTRARPIHERLADLLLRASERSGVDEQPLIREAVDALEDLKVAELREYFGDGCLSNLETTTPEVLPDTTLLYPILLPDRVELVVGRGGRFDRYASPLGPEPLRRESARLRRALQDPTTPRFRPIAARLYDALIRPLPPEALASDATLTIVASGALREIPPAALFDDREKAFLIEQVPVATLPTLRIIAPERIDPRRARMLAVGHGEATGEFEALPSVGREIEAVSRPFEATRQLGAAFSVEAFEQALDQRAYDLVHIASHGRFDADANESYLVTADGRLGLPELAQIIARTRHRTSRPIELLTLSACETALGDERAVLGLAGVAIQSGARSAIATLWRVNDEATARLFEVFYAELGDRGRSRSHALQRAQLTLLEERRFRHPVYWSPFLLINSWR